MLAHCAYDIARGEEVTLRPPEEYVLNVAQIALSAEAQGIGVKGGKIKSIIEPTVVQVKSKDIQGNDVTSTLCTLDHTCRQVSVAVTFGWDEDVVFSLAEGGGEGPVSITGYLQPSPEGMDNEDGMEGALGDSDEEDSDGNEEGKEEGGGSDSDDGSGSEDEAPQLAKRKRSFDLDADAVEARSHGKDEPKKKKKEERAPVPTPPKEDDSDSEDDSDEDEEEELDEEAKLGGEVDEDDEDDDEDEDLTPEDEYALALAEAIEDKGGECKLSALGNVPRPEGLPKTKVSVFIKKRSDVFKTEGASVRLIESTSDSE